MTKFECIDKVEGDSLPGVVCSVEHRWAIKMVYSIPYSHPKTYSVLFF
jgi:hypothetical protein